MPSLLLYMSAKVIIYSQLIHIFQNNTELLIARILDHIWSNYQIL